MIIRRITTTGNRCDIYSKRHPQGDSGGERAASTGGDTLWASGIAAYEALVPFRQLLGGCVQHDFRKSFPEYKYRKTEAEHQRWREAVAKKSTVATSGGANASGDR